MKWNRTELVKPDAGTQVLRCSVDYDLFMCYLGEEDVWHCAETDDDIIAPVFWLDLSEIALPKMEDNPNQPKMKTGILMLYAN